MRTGVRFAGALVSAAILSVMSAFPAVAQAASPVPDQVSLSEQTMTWSTVKYATTAENGLVSGSLDKNTIIDRTFRTYVLENRYLKVTLVPEFGFVGLKPGDRWCLCAPRWQEAFEAGMAPPVVLEATHAATLEWVQLSDLVAHAVSEP